TNTTLPFRDSDARPANAKCDRRILLKRQRSRRKEAIAPFPEPFAVEERSLADEQRGSGSSRDKVGVRLYVDFDHVAFKILLALLEEATWFVVLHTARDCRFQRWNSHRFMIAWFFARGTIVLGRHGYL